MSKVLTLFILVAFAFFFIANNAEATLPLDAMVQPAPEAGTVEPLTMEYVAVTVASSPFYEHPHRDYFPRDAEVETPYTTNEAAEVEGSRGTAIRFGGVTRL